ncbi:hypothetical protein Tco_0085840 [Tanacetum coccineum]
MEYYKNLTFNASDEEVTSKVKTHEKRKRDVGSMSSEELVLWVPIDVEMTLKELEIPMSVGSLAGSAANVPDEELEMAVAGLVANNVVGAKVVPFSMVRGPLSPKSVPNFAPCDEACKTLSSATTKGQRPKGTIKLPSHLRDYAM